MVRHFHVRHFQHPRCFITQASRFLRQRPIPTTASDADDVTTSTHTLFPYFPEKRQFNYELRDCCHYMTLVAKNPKLSEHDFIIRTLYHQQML